MTPAAARLFRTTDDPKLRAALAASQFFETSAIYELAGEMVTADIDAGAMAYSEMAQLPAISTVIEFMMGDGRVMMICRQQDARLQYRAYLQMGKELIFTLGCGFVLGTEENLPAEWNTDMLQHWARAPVMSRMHLRTSRPRE